MINDGKVLEAIIPDGEVEHSQEIYFSEANPNIQFKNKFTSAENCRDGINKEMVKEDYD